MQQNKGSILLYVLFLSSFLILFFISFQGELEKMLEWAKDSERNVQDISSTKDMLLLLKNAPSATKTIPSNANLSLISLNQSGTIFSESLGWKDIREYWVISSGGASSIALGIIEGGPASYRLAAFNSGSEASSIAVSSGTVTGNSTIPLSSSLNTHILTIDPMGGYVRYNLNTSTTNTIPSSSSYQLERDINGYKKNEGVYDIVNFIPKSRSGFNYQSMGMYLKE